MDLQSDDKIGDGAESELGFTVCRAGKADTVARRAGGRGLRSLAK